MSLTISQVFAQCKTLYASTNHAFFSIVVPVQLDIYDSLYEASRTDSNFKPDSGYSDISGKTVLVYQPPHKVDIPVPKPGGGTTTFPLFLGPQMSGTFTAELDAQFHGAGGGTTLPGISIVLYESFLATSSGGPTLIIRGPGIKTQQVHPSANQAPVVVTLPTVVTENPDGPGTFEKDTTKITLTLGAPSTFHYFKKAPDYKPIGA